MAHMPKIAGPPPSVDEKATHGHPWTFYYDGYCDFCTTGVRGLSRIDYFRRVRWIAFQTLDEPPPGLTWEDLNCAAYLSTGKGRLYEGFYGFRMLTLRLLTLLPLAPFFWFPGMNLLGVPVYRWIVRNRYRISACRAQAPESGGHHKGVDSHRYQATDHPPEVR